MEEKGIVQAQNKECSLQKSCFGPPVTRLRRPFSGRGVLNGIGPLGECTDLNSDRVRLDAVLMVTYF